MSYDPDIFMHYYWHKTAKNLKYSSEVLYNKLTELYDRENEVKNVYELHDNQLAIFQSHMMLIGFALENLFKEVAIKKYTSQGNSITAFDDLQKKYGK